MIDTNDPLERLRAANPVPLAEVALLPPDPVLFDRITSALPGPVADRPRRRRARRLVPVLLVTSLLGGAVAYGLLRGDVASPETVACFERGDLTASVEVPSVGAAGPVEACASLWRRGALGGGTEVPPLVACVLPTGVAGVFPVTPGTDVCTALNLVPITPSPPPPPPPTTTRPGPAPAPPAGRRPQHPDPHLPRRRPRPVRRRGVHGAGDGGGSRPAGTGPGRPGRLDDRQHRVHRGTPVRHAVTARRPAPGGAGAGNTAPVGGQDRWVVNRP